MDEQGKKDNENKGKDELLVLLVVLLFVVIIVVYAISYRLGRIDVLIPKVVDTIGKDVVQENNNPSNETKNGDTIKPLSKPNKQPVGPAVTEIDTVKITNIKAEWNVTRNLNIFSNPRYNYALVVAPEQEHYYQFMVDNETEFPIEYDLVFADTNVNNINLKYKLKLGSSYLTGLNDWTSIEDISVARVVLAAKSKHAYTIEWKWLESTEEIDTLAAGHSYVLTIDVIARERIGD